MARRIGAGAYLAPTASVDPTLNIPDYCYIGYEAQVSSGVILTQHCTIGNRSRLTGNIRLDFGVQIGADCTLVGEIRASENVRIGRGVTIGLKCAPGISPGTPTRIGPKVWIGRQSTLLGGVQIGEQACLLPDSVLEGDLIGHCQAGGEPARMLGPICTCGHTMMIGETPSGPPIYVCTTCGMSVRFPPEASTKVGCLLLAGGKYGAYLPLENRTRTLRAVHDL